MSMSEPTSGAAKSLSGPQADGARAPTSPDYRRNNSSFSQFLRGGGKEPRGSQAGPRLGDKQIPGAVSGAAPEAALDAGSAGSCAQRAWLGEAEEGGSGERQRRDGQEGPHAGLELLDPLVRCLASPPSRALPVAAPVPAAFSPELDQLLRDLVRRAAWGGDRRRGTARIELGAGELAGATLLVEADANDLRIDLELPAGVPAEPWRQRLAARLSERGFAVCELNVH